MFLQPLDLSTAFYELLLELFFLRFCLRRFGIAV